MIFLSHQHKDRETISAIARGLELTYGKENIFYDDWLIEPGESMNERVSVGLEKPEYFFYFITENSLDSKLLNLEWTSAIEAISKDVKFIPIKIGQVDLPETISTLNYLEMNNNKIFSVLQQIKEIINPELHGYVYPENNDSFRYIIKGNKYLESNGIIVAATNLNDTEAEFIGKDFEYNTDFVKNGFNSKKDDIINAFMLSFPDVKNIESGLELIFKFKSNRQHKKFKINLLYFRTVGKVEEIKLTPVSSRDQVPWLDE